MIVSHLYNSHIFHSLNIAAVSPRNPAHLHDAARPMLAPIGQHPGARDWRSASLCNVHSQLPKSAPQSAFPCAAVPSLTSRAFSRLAGLCVAENGKA